VKTEKNSKDNNEKDPSDTIRTEDESKALAAVEQMDDVQEESV
jgi:hypothetical protein